ncbi:Spore coat associated protein JA (CotJA) [Geosporobacter subterraneus DSM 17957]|uniref:Spore coat associated protein JA (CotJA) n=1 Tax=Geosporobacter subterraneus DSM 17957 TaxID=1121919 RepID=A0A1M6IIU6_9FIRM|nr:spore coat associated protein CotJA [Geosporobacter subterraneus]SHJ34354.1 Spore coat associated protein JA (CotJA) [Geosporobacter subterraneus DSM 17957]
MKRYDPMFEDAALNEEIEKLRVILARAYVPYQCYFVKYPLPVALEVGTLFPELVKPWPPFYYDPVVGS